MLKEWECWGDYMRGVSFVKSRNTWKVTYGKNKREYFGSESEAIARRKELETMYGIPQWGHRRKEIKEQKVGNFKIIGDTGENTYTGTKKVLLRNLTNGEIIESTVSGLKAKKFGVGSGNYRNKTLTGKRYITQAKKYNKYVFRICSKKAKFSKYGFNTLSEAVTYRNKFLKEHNLPIPD